MRNFFIRVLLVLALFALPAVSRTKRAQTRVMRMEATAFSLDSKATSAGTVPHKGIAAADPAVLPLGSRIRVTGAGAHSGIYTVTDTGNKIAGRRIDIYMPSRLEAKRFGRKAVRVQILQKGDGKDDARAKDIPDPRASR